MDKLFFFFVAVIVVLVIIIHSIFANHTPASSLSAIDSYSISTTPSTTSIITIASDRNETRQICRSYDYPEGLFEDNSGTTTCAEIKEADVAAEHRVNFEHKQWCDYTLKNGLPITFEQFQDCVVTK